MIETMGKTSRNGEGIPRPSNPIQAELARRLSVALDESQTTPSELARECGVTPQAVYGWCHHGKIGKQHFVDIARKTGKPLEYFFAALRAAMVLLALTFSAPQTSEAAILHKENYLLGYVSQVVDSNIHYAKWLVARLRRIFRSFLTDTYALVPQ